MHAKTLSVGLVVLAGWLLICSHGFAQQPPTDSAKAKQIVALVKKAAALIESQCPLACRSAFAEFRRSGSEWRTGDTYLFVADTKGMALFNAGFPNLEGTDVSALKDANGKFIHEDVWRYLFTHPAEEIGEPVPHDPDCSMDLRAMLQKPATRKQ